jgi:hypothetical protein
MPEQTSPTSVPSTTIPGTTSPSTTSTTTPSTTTALTTTVPTTTTTTLPPFVGGTDPVAGEGEGFGLLTEVRMASHRDFDRFVLEFRGARPGYRAGFVEPPFRDIPGSMVGVAGNAFLAVNLSPAMAVDLETVPIEPTYVGPDRIRVSTVNVTEAVFVTDFEADMEWLLGLAEATAFKVMELDDPPRIVVDVGHGTTTRSQVATAWITGTGTGLGWLTDARLAGQEELDRFVLEFSPDHASDVGEPGVPDYEVHYVAGPFTSCDADLVPVGGDQHLLVTLKSAFTTDWNVDPPLVTYEGPLRLHADTANVVEAVLANDCERGLQWVIGLDRVGEIGVATMDDPPRLVVEVAH